MHNALHGLIYVAVCGIIHLTIPHRMRSLIAFIAVTVRPRTAGAAQCCGSQALIYYNMSYHACWEP